MSRAWKRGRSHLVHGGSRPKWFYILSQSTLSFKRPKTRDHHKESSIRRFCLMPPRWPQKSSLNARGPSTALKNVSFVFCFNFWSVRSDFWSWTRARLVSAVNCGYRSFLYISGGFIHLGDLILSWWQNTFSHGLIYKCFTFFLWKKKLDLRIG